MNNIIFYTFIAFSSVISANGKDASLTAGEIEDLPKPRLELVMKCACRYNALPENVKAKAHATSVAEALAVVTSQPAGVDAISAEKASDLLQDMKRMVEFTPAGKLVGTPGLNTFMQSCMSAAFESKEKRNAQNLASTYTAGRAAGAPALQEVTNLTDAIQMVLKGFSGAGPFANAKFQVECDEASAKQASRHLQFDAKQKTIRYVPQPGLEATAAAADALEIVAPRFAAFAAEMSDPHGKAERNAQNFVSTFSAGKAAGSTALKKAKSLEEIRALLAEGISGAGPFKDTTFQITMTKEDLQASTPFLRFDPQHGLEFVARK